MGDLAAPLDVLEEARVVLGIVEPRREAPGAELRDLDLEPATRLADRLDILSLPGPELDGGEPQPRRLFNAADEGQLAPPHLEVHREARPAELERRTRRLVLRSSGGDNGGARGEGGAAFQKTAAVGRHLHSSARLLWELIVL